MFIDGLLYAALQGEGIVPVIGEAGSNADEPPSALAPARC